MWGAPYYQNTSSDSTLAMTTDSTGSGTGSKSPRTSENSSLEQSPVLSFTDHFEAAFSAYTPVPQSVDTSALQAQDAWVEPPKKVVHNERTVWQVELAQAGLMGNTTSAPVKCISPSLMCTPNPQSQAYVEQPVTFNQGHSQTVDHNPVAVGAQCPGFYGMDMSNQYLNDMSDASAIPSHAEQQYIVPSVIQGTNPPVQYANDISNAAVYSQYTHQQYAQLPTFQGTTLPDQTWNNFSDASEFLQYTNQIPYSESMGQVPQNYAQQQQVGSSAFLAPSFDTGLYPNNPVTFAPPEVRLNGQVMDNNQASRSYNNAPISSDESVSLMPSGQTAPIVATHIQPQPNPPPPPPPSSAAQPTTPVAAPRSNARSPVPARKQKQPKRPRQNGAGRSRKRVSMTKKAVIKELKASFEVPSWLLEGRRYQNNMTHTLLETERAERWRKHGLRFFPDLEPIGGGDADYLRDLLQRFRERRLATTSNEGSSSGGGNNGSNVGPPKIWDTLLELDVVLTQRQIDLLKEGELRKRTSTPSKKNKNKNNARRV